MRCPLVKFPTCRPWAKELAEKERDSGEIGGKQASGAEARADFVGVMYGLKPVPFVEWSFSASWKARVSYGAVQGT